MVGIILFLLLIVVGCTIPEPPDPNAPEVEFVEDENQDAVGQAIKAPTKGAKYANPKDVFEVSPQSLELRPDEEAVITLSGKPKKFKKSERLFSTDGFEYNYGTKKWKRFKFDGQGSWLPSIQKDISIKATNDGKRLFVVCVKNKSRCTWMKQEISWTIQQFTYERARDRAISSIIMPSTLPDAAHVIMSSELLPAGTKISDGPFNTVTLQEAAFLLWIDPLPEALFGHDTVYTLLFRDNTQILTGTGWPIINGEDLRVGETSVSISPSSTSTAAPVKEKMQAPAAFHTPVKPLYIPPPRNKQIPEDDECPPGYIESSSVKLKEVGVSRAAVTTNNREVIDFMGEAFEFLEATAQAGYGTNMISTATALGEELQRLAISLEPGSTFAMFISSHGQQLWNVRLKNVRTGEELTIEDFQGEPTVDIKPDVDYSDCFEGDSILGSLAKCKDLTTHAFGLPDGYTITSRDRSGWCFILDEKCVKFDPDIHLASLPSCRKFLATNACYGGSITLHNVKGLSAYAGSTKDELSWGFAGYTDKTPTQFGKYFLSQLKNSPPRDPVQPDEDEPKPDFDSAYANAQSHLSESTVSHTFEVNVQTANGEGITTRRVAKKTEVNQHPVQYYLPHDTDCTSKKVCVPLLNVDPPSGLDDCAAAKHYVFSIPEVLTTMAEQKEKYPYNKDDVYQNMLDNLEALKECYACPSSTEKSWTNCDPYSDAYTIINNIAGIVTNVRAAQTVLLQAAGNVEVQLGYLQECTLQCKDSAQVVTPPASGQQPICDGFNVFCPGETLGEPSTLATQCASYYCPCRFAEAGFSAYVGGGTYWGRVSCQGPTGSELAQCLGIGLQPQPCPEGTTRQYIDVQTYENDQQHDASLPEGAEVHEVCWADSTKCFDQDPDAHYFVCYDTDGNEKQAMC